MRVLSGIQPTGRFHWGNYFGAIRQYIDLQTEDEAYYFIANLHALTTVRDPAVLKQLTLDAAIDLLALGLDPEKAILFVQSDVPEVSELCWILMTDAPLGLLERCHAYKDKKSKGLTAEAGLFTYPVLMAADILAYDADVVPVGEDQVQHIEVCRDLAQRFNSKFGQTFVLPKSKLLDSSAKVPGLDGEKMSKSYNNTLEVFEDAGQQRKKIMRIPTDSRPMEEPKDPASDVLFQLFSLVATDVAREEMAALYRRGGFGYGEVKKALADAAEAFFGEARERRAQWESRPDDVRDVLKAGAAKARTKASSVLERAQLACGIKEPRRPRPTVDIVEEYERNLLETTALLRNQEFSKESTSIRKSWSGWVFEQTIRNRLTAELKTLSSPVIIREEVSLIGRARVDFVLDDAIAIEVKSLGIFAKSDAERYRRYRQAAEAKGWQYFYVTREPYPPFETLMQDVFGSSRAFFINRPGEWERFVKEVKHVLVPS